MIKTNKIISMAMVAMAMIVSLASPASAADLNWSIDTAVTIGGNTYTIVSGSVATAPFVVGAADLTVTVPAGTFTLTSANGYAFTLSDATGTAQTCSGATNQLVITGSVAAKTVTPDTGTVSCAGGGGSGGGSSDVTPPGLVTNITVAVDLGKVVLSWTKPADSDFSSVKIYRSTVSGTIGSAIATNIITTNYTDTSVTNGVTYYYTIRAVDTKGNENTTTVQTSAVPGVPTATPTPTPTPTPTATPLPGPATPAAPSGVTLYRVEGSPRVYVIKEGKKEWIKTAEEFNLAGYKWGEIVVTTADVLAAFPDLAASTGIVLYRADGDSKVYLVKDGIKQWIKTAEEFTSKGYKWSDIVLTTPSVVASFPEGTVALARVKVINTGTLRVRKSNTTASSILGYVYRNNLFDVIEKKSGWYKVTIPGGIVGWISGAYTQEQ